MLFFLFSDPSSNPGQNTGDFSHSVPMPGTLRSTQPPIKLSIRVSLVLLGTLGR